jgi:hypothetical protein
VRLSEIGGIVARTEARIAIDDGDGDEWVVPVVSIEAIAAAESRAS